MAIAGKSLAGLGALLVMLAALQFMAARAPSQAPTPGSVVSPCAKFQAVAASDLEARKAQVEAELQAKRTQLEAVAPSAGADNVKRRAQLKHEVVALETRLLDILEQQECARVKAEPLRGTGEIVTITNFYATNRAPTGQADFANFYDGIDNETLQYGRIEITIPATHTLGNLELPTLWKLEWNADPNKHFVIKDLKPLAGPDALNQLRAAAGAAKSKVLLLFVHGFNCTFADAALRTAQLSFDLQFPGVSMFLSWPATRNYSHDVESVEVSKPILNALLDDIGKLPFDEVYILAHSMGGRLVTNVLADRHAKGADLAKVRDIMLAAPDINVKTFKNEIAPVLGKMLTARKTIYASSNDWALRTSRTIQDFPRLGETTTGVLTFAGFETIDSSNVGTILRSYGHSYVFDSAPVLADLELLLVGRKEAAKRRLKSMRTPPNQYWLLE